MPRTLTRLGLIVALLLGVGAMHTLGHPHGGEHSAAHAAADAAVPVDHSAVPGVHVAAAGVPDLDPTTMCLAVGAVVVLLFGAMAALAQLPWQFGAPPLRRTPLPPKRDASPRGAPTRAELQVYVI